ncbi:HAMP domain-containing sensor histidine kinase [Paraglaciecola sp.]|uniref:sensor histidine kinase n=1 Tax=Paraglaciecola sp. TaxID=1920173 RepID=UPI003266CD85
MKIRPSLKLYFFISVLLLGSVMAIGFSFLSVNYFIDGLDRSLNGVMFELAKTADVKDEHPVDIAGINIASRWQDTPEVIQRSFVNPPSVIGDLQKQKVQTTIFTMPKSVYFLVLFESPEGEPRFISRVMLEKDFIASTNAIKPSHRLFWTFVVAILAIVLFAFLLFMIMRKIARPIESLRNWAKSLNPKNVQAPPPDFTYNELNVLASLIQGSLISTHQSLEREQRFLSYASHEIRTPIAVIRSNVELLQRLNEKQPTTEKQHLVLERIQRAGLTMSNLTDTLLWLSRNEELNVAPEPLNLEKEVQQACVDLEYLLKGKNVEVTVQSEAHKVDTIAVACHIVINNLIRNAYQHTQEGQVLIKQQGSRITILNSNSKSDTGQQKSDANQVAFGEGYGLGLQLSEKIVQHHNWYYEKTNTQEYYQAVVDFEKQGNSVNE